uniref:Uncharacterized protein n=1 Tax=Eutreptiella gymnastica TaxID=73025 RepID=A0A7S4FJ72_9EUGL
MFEATTGASDHCESVSIDSVSDANPAKNQSIRYAGAVLLVSIEYDNTKTFNHSNVQFTMTVTRLPRSQYKLEYQSQRDSTELLPTSIIEDTVHGVLLMVVQTGKLGAFDATQMLVQITAGLTLMYISSATVLFVSTVLMRRRDYYFKCMFVESDSLGLQEEEPNDEGERKAQGNVEGDPSPVESQAQVVHSDEERLHKAPVGPADA